MGYIEFKTHPAVFNINVGSLNNNESSIANANSRFLDLALYLNTKIERELEGRAKLDAFGSCLLGWGMSDEFPVCEFVHMHVSVRVRMCMFACRAILHLPVFITLTFVLICFSLIADILLGNCFRFGSS